MDWDDQDWAMVIFLDEKEFNLFASGSREWCWRKPGQALEDPHIRKMVKHGGGSIMVWGCITSKGVGQLHQVVGNMDSKQYTKILQESLLCTLEDHETHPDQFIFQQDLDSKHTSSVTQCWLNNHNIDVLNWAPNSPDMNIIKHVWHCVDTKIHLQSPLPSNLSELWVAVQEEWRNLEPDYISSLFEGMPWCVKALVEAQGGYTKY